MKRILLIVLSITLAGTLAIAQAQEDTNTTNCESVDGECCCGGTVDGCTGDCDDCDECDCDSGSGECTDCKEINPDCKDCTGCDSNCDDCTSEEVVEEVHHCGGCH